MFGNNVLQNQSIAWYMHTIMSVLAKLLSSRTRAEVLRLLFGLDLVELHVREIARRAGFNIQTVRQELEKLENIGIVSARRSGNRLYFKANMNHPLYPDLHNIVLKTVGLVDLLKKSMEGHEIIAAFVFGSIAAGTEDASSDIDLMAIGDISLRELSSLLAEVQQALGREINPYPLTATEYKNRLKSEDHFLTSVINTEKLFVIGNQNVLESLG